MARTRIHGQQVTDGSIELVDLSSALASTIEGKADAGNLAPVATSGSYDDLTNLPTLFSGAYADLSGKPTLFSGDYADLSNKPSLFDGNYSSLSGAPVLSTVATSGSYNDLSNLPTLFSGSYTDLTNKPILFSGSYNDLSDKPSIPSIAGLATETYVDTKVADLVASAPAVLDTLNELAAALGDDANFATTVAGQIGDVAGDVSALDTRVTVAEGDIVSLQTDVAAKADSASLAAVATSGSYNDLSNLPTLFSGAYADLSGKPTLFSGSYNDLSDKPTFSSDLDGLTDVAITSPSADQVLKYNGTSWVNATAPATFSGSYTDLTNKPTIPSALDDLSDVAVSSAVKGQFIVHNGTSFVNSNTIEASGAAVKPLIVKGAASQTANLFEAQNSSGTALVSVESSGKVNLAGGGAGSCALAITGNMGTPSNIPTFTSSGIYAGTYPVAANDEQAWIRINSSNASYVGIIDFASTNTAYSSWRHRIGASATGTLEISTSNSANTDRNVVAEFNGWSNTKPSLRLTARSAAAQGLIVQGAASQTAVLFEAQNSAGTAVAQLWPSGALTLSSSLSLVGGINFGPASSGMALTTNGSYNGVALGRGTSTGESGLALGSYVSAGSNEMRIGWGGGGLGRIMYGLSTGELGIGVASPGAQLHAQAKSAAMKGLIVQGAASQTANLFEAQNSSGTALFSIDKDGSMTAGAVPVARVTGLHAVATSGSYNDLSDKPSIPSIAGLATETYVDTAVAAVVNSAPAVLDTLNELAAALNDDPNFATTMTTALAAKADSSSLADVATSGSYVDLSNKPTIYTPVKETFTASVNGTATQFVLANAPAVAGTEQVFVNGLLQSPGAGDDYTISGATITFNTAPESGWKLVVYYFV